MIIIGEKINGTIPSVKKAIAERNADFIMKRAVSQTEAGAGFIDVCASTSADEEYDALKWLIETVQQATELPLCVDSPNEFLLKRIFEEGLVNKPGMLNSVNEEGTKCETIFPLIAGTPWQVKGLTCDKDGIPDKNDKKIEIAKRMIDKADKYGVALENFHIDPCVMALSTRPTAQLDFEECIRRIKEYAPAVKITGAISNISFDMPLRKIVNQNCMAMAIHAGLDSAIMDPTYRDMLGVIFVSEALSGKDTSGRKFNRAYRKGIIGPKNQA